MHKQGLVGLRFLEKGQDTKNAFADFNVARVASFGEGMVEELLQDSAIIRNRKKIEATIHNARKFLEVQKEFGSFDKYIWGFVDHKPIQNSWGGMKDVPVTTPLSDQLSKGSEKEGF